jgi:hypothetical protein
MTGCTSGKVGHHSESAARRAAVAVARVRMHDRPRVYECQRCHCWHLTSAPRLRRAFGRRHHQRIQEPTVATRAELDAWFAAHSRPTGQVLGTAQDSLAM